MKIARLQCSSKEGLVRLSVNLDPECLSEKSFSSKEQTCLVALHTQSLAGSSFGNLGNKAVDFRVVGWSS